MPFKINGVEFWNTPSRSKMSEAGTQITPVPMAGIKAKNPITKPQNKGEGMPKRKNPSAPKIPCIMAISKKP